MNEDTADNNGVYLLDGRYGNSCRQSRRERERERDRQCGSIALCRSIALRSVDPCTSAPLLLPTCFSFSLRTVLSKNCHTIALNIYCEAPVQQANCFVPTYIYIKPDAAK